MSAKGPSKHLFVSTAPVLRDRWVAAFPQARLLAPNDALSDACDMVWLHLSPGAPVTLQVKAIADKMPTLPIIALSDLPNDLEGMAAFSNGARGYCNANAVPEIFRRAFDVVMEGGVWIGMSLMQRMLNAASKLPQAENAPKWSDSLTAREREVAVAISRAASNKEIARQLGVTERTVKAHVTAIFAKVGVRDRMQLSLKIRGHSID